MKEFFALGPVLETSINDGQLEDFFQSKKKKMRKWQRLDKLSWPNGLTAQDVKVAPNYKIVSVVKIVPNERIPFRFKE